jgi:type II secretory pathway pseudopilin PulG
VNAARTFYARRCTPGRQSARRGYTLLEIQIAFAALGIGLAGLCPFVVMQIRQVRQLELRLQGQVVVYNPVTATNQTMLQGVPYFIVPWTNVMAQKLAGSGQILTTNTNSCDPGNLPLTNPAPMSYPVTIVQLDAAPGSQSVSAYVTVTAP